MCNSVYLIVFRCTMAMCLEQLLKQYRMAQSAARGIPCYLVFGDVVLKQIAAARPASLDALTKFKGMGEGRAGMYGEDIVKLVAQSERGDKRQQVRMGRSRIFQRLLRDPPCAPRSLKQEKTELAKRCFEPTAPEPACDVYILELAQGKVYVGKTSNKSRRMAQHSAGGGSAFTRAYPPTGKQLPRLGNVSGRGDAAERDETLRYMFLRGVQNVRGWRYTQVAMSREDEDDAEANIRELFDLCRRCGHPGHFISQCRYNFDRLGRCLRRR